MAIVTVTDVMALLASEGVSVGLAHCVPAVPTQACGIVIAMIAATAANERVIFSITNWFLVGSAEVKREKTSPLFETALVLVRLEHNNDTRRCFGYLFATFYLTNEPFRVNK